MASKDTVAIGAWAAESRDESGAWRRVDSQMATLPPPNERTAREDSNDGFFFMFRSLEDHVLECEGGSGAWWHVGTPCENSSGA